MDAMDFEGRLRRLEEIVRKIEEGNVSLNESLRFIAEGKRIAQTCLRQLEGVENSVKIVSRDAEGNLILEDFEAEFDDGETAKDN
ncbi:MAG: exodeoxyribonuclease VII small subunit [bacterium]